MLSPLKVPKDLPLIAALWVLNPNLVTLPALKAMNDVSTSLKFLTGIGKKGGGMKIREGEKN